MIEKLVDVVGASTGRLSVGGVDAGLGAGGEAEYSDNHFTTFNTVVDSFLSQYGFSPLLGNTVSYA